VFSPKKYGDPYLGRRWPRNLSFRLLAHQDTSADSARQESQNVGIYNCWKPLTVKGNGIDYQLWQKDALVLSIFSNNNQGSSFVRVVVLDGAQLCPLKILSPG
jgi:hypothetical protein